MAAKKLKGTVSKTAAIALASVLAGTGIAVSMQGLVSTQTASAAGNTYTSDYASKHEAIEAGYALNLKVAEEGMVLLKNENNTLPLLTQKGMNATRVTVFGIAGISPQGGSGANGGDTSSGQVGDAGTFYKTLEAAGYAVNPYVKDFYSTNKEYTNAQGNPTAETDFHLKTKFDAAKDRLEASYSSYGDAAFVILTKGDATNDAYDETDNPDGIKYNKQYNKAQYELIEHAAENFDKVIVLINSAYPMEIDEIKNNPKVDAILEINEPGTNGLASAGRIINGEVSPSGRLADTYPVDQTKDSTYVNYSTINLGRYVGADGNPVATTSGFTDYEEGIYVGYRYWETRAAEEKAAVLAANASATDEEQDKWWTDNVSYTFGYGMSYTTFSWEVTPRTAANSTISDAKGTLKFDVKVTNTGDYAGKEVVQLYLKAPYIDGQIEKAENVLEDFAKTDTLQPGESQTVTLSVKVKDLASYDWKDANNNGIRGYELDNGEYALRIMSCAHYGLSTNDTEIKYTVAGTDGNTNKSIYVQKAETGYTIENQFEYMNAYASGYSDTLTDKDGNKYSTYDFKTITDGAIGFDKPMSRASTHTGDAGATGLQVPATAPVNVTTTFEKLAEFAGQTIDDSEDQPWYVAPENMPKYMTNADREEKPEADVKLADLVGKAYDDPLWDKLLDQLTLLEMQNLINEGGWNTGAIEYIGKPSTRDTDGPKGWSGSGRGGETGNMICAEPMVAATFNLELIYEVGKNMGDQGLWGSTDRTDGGAQESYTCWYAPGMNLHRGSFDGRLAEYYSEDPVLMGKMAAAISSGIRSKGGYITMKHFALHQDGGTVRSGFGVSGESVNGLYAWVDEQTLRELYLRSYQICAAEGEANDAMASFTRFGYINAGANYALNTELFRNEWGCNGYIVTDIVLDPFQDGNQLIRAGGNLLLTAAFIGDTAKIFVVDPTTGEPLAAGAPNKNADVTATQVMAMRNATKGILWSVANSNAMQVPPGAEVRYTAGESILNATAGTEVSFDLATATLGTGYAYSSIRYSAQGTIPGMTFTSRSGQATLGGTPTVAGVYTVTVTATAEGYTPVSRDYTIVVAAADATNGVLAAIEELNTKLDALGTKVDAIDLAAINTKLDAIKTAVDGNNSQVNTALKALEDRVAALEASAEAGCNGDVGVASVGAIFGIAALGFVVYAIVKRSKKNEQ